MPCLSIDLPILSVGQGNALVVANETRRDKKAFFSSQCKEIEENNEWKSLEISSRKLEIPREHFMQRWAQ